MAQYTANCNATSNSTATTDDVFIRVLNSATASALIKRVRVSFPATTPADYEAQIMVQRVTGTAAGTTATLAATIKRRQSAPASALPIAQLKSGTNAFPSGSVTDTVIKASVNTRSVFEWIARDEYDYIEAALGASAGVQIQVQVSSASQLINAEIDWEE